MNRFFKPQIVLFLASMILAACQQSNAKKDCLPETITISRSGLLDKIKGGWAGQTIGVTYGGPTEFKYKGMIIPDSIAIPWHVTGYGKWWFENQPGLYDDVYMDLTFVQVFEEYGLDTPVDSFARAFANAEFPLWHANQIARYNLLNGISPPRSGHWKNNPHADDIDFQIESDFAGLMSPGMPVTAAEICDKIGHIMTHGDGWYGGVYVAAMYSLAFVSNDIGFIVRKALEMIPEESDFFACITDVINWSETHKDWKHTWKLLEDAWGDDQGCPKGFSDPYNIEAKLNCAYILIGLLYGEGDMMKTIDISTRCGQDSDCNPSNAGGILGTILGYSNIPDYLLNNVKEVEDIVFPYTSLSLNDAYSLSMKHALELIERNGGKVSKKNIAIKCQQTMPVRYEKNFEGIMPVKKQMLNRLMTDTNFSIDFEGSGVLISAQFPGGEKSVSDYCAQVEIWIDGQYYELVKFPANHLIRKPELYWNYDLTPGPHKLELKLLNPSANEFFNLNYLISYSAYE